MKVAPSSIRVLLTSVLLVLAVIVSWPADARRMSSSSRSVTPALPQSPSETYQASTDFSASQGYRNWYYLDSNGSQMAWDANGWWQGPETYLRLWSTGDHPGNYTDSVRQWRAPSSGSIRITGTAYDHNAGCGDGVVVSIRRGTQVFWTQTIENGNATGFSYDVTMNVAAGDPINFVVNGRSACWCDGTTFDPTITLTRSASSTYQAYPDFSSVQGQRNWYYLESNGNQMTWNGSLWQGSETYLLLEPASEHPGTYLNAVRQWRAPSSGSIRITGTAADMNTSCGDGVNVSIKHGTQVIWQQTIDNGNTTGFSYDLTRTVAAGDQIKFVTNARSNWLCDSTNFNPTIVLTPPDSTPFSGTPISLPGTIQVEDFDNGGEGFAYHDTTPGNAGGGYRTNTDVDVGGNSSGYNVGWTISGEWSKYSVNVATTDSYTIQAQVSSVYCCPNIHVEVDGTNVTGPMSVPNTGGFGAWQTISKTGVQIPAGFHVVKLVTDSPDGHLIDWLQVLPSLPITPTSVAAVSTSASQINVSWTDASYNETGFTVERKTGANGAWAQIATPAANATSYGDTGLQPNTSYYYRVRATNLGGDSAYSNEANATTLNAPPTVSLTAPANNASFANDSTINMVATASDTDGISKVEFFQGTTKLGEDTNGGDGYTFNWANVFAGSYQLTAKATDNFGATTISNVVSATVTLPIVTVTATDATAAEGGSDFGTFTITRTGGTSAALQVNFSLSGNATAGSDYASIGSSVTIPAGAASQTVTISPVDDATVEGTETVTLTLANNSSHNAGTPSNATVNISDNDTNPPTVSLTAPANNATFANDSTINIVADPQDSDGTISKVEFFQGTTKLGEDTSSIDGYTFSWTNVFAGSYQLTAKATDNMGATATSSVVNVTVTLPLITISATDPSAAEAGSDTGTFTITRTGGTSAALAVNFSVSGSATSGDYSAVGTSTTIPAGVASLTITITPADDTSVEGTETVIMSLAGNSSYTVGDPANATVSIADNDQPPAINLTAPTTGAVFTAPGNLTLSATATDADGIAKVAFYQNGQLLGEDTVAPYSFDWTNIAAGNYTVAAIATDTANATGNSQDVSIVVNAPPTVNITSPANNATFTGSSVTINADAADADGGITKVEFFQNGTTKLGEDTNAPYSFVWSNPSEGNSTLTAVATDGYGASTTSAAIQISVERNNARLDPLNRTGGAGEDPLSRNFNWSLPLVGLPGRSGLNLGLSLSYNSLATWTKSGSQIAFNQDHGFPAPGFRLGFPVIQTAFYNSQAQKDAFLMITPSGARVELRRIGSSSLYQSVDSSYLLLDASTMTLKSPDGTQLSYELHGGEFQCTQIKDRNGNLITVNYDDLGRIDKVIDTLGREVKFNYAANGDLTYIKQSWTVNGQNATHTWATFTYADLPLQTNFGSLQMIGAQNGSSVRVLTSVKLPDQSHFDFEYTSWGQVWKVSSYATETNDHLLNYRSYNLALDNSTPVDDCPRFTERHDWAANWNRNASGVEQEAITFFAAPVADSWTLPDGTSQSGLRAQVTQPQGLSHKIYFAGTAGTATGWQRGLPSLVETYDSANVRQRQSVTTWTQDDPNVGYLLNPRVTETNVYDPVGNRARTRVDYASFSLSDGTTCHYPQDTYEYGANGATVMRRTRTDYQMTSTYTDRRILGLPSASYVCDGAQGEVSCNDSSGSSLLSKVTLQYDEAGSIQGNDAPIQHNNPGYVAGRANVSSLKRYDVVNSGQFTMSSMQYNTAGSIVKSIDAANHETEISYADAFAGSGTSLDTGLPSPTLAYPTTITNPGGYTANTRYNYQFGAPTWKQTPLPNVTDNQPGPQQKIEYDSIGRLQRVTNLVNNAYTSYAYGPNYVETWSTVNTVTNEAQSLQVFDGHGRVIGKASNHPGSSGGYSGQLTVYDVMGRATSQSNPTETSVSVSGAPLQPYTWAAAGDDAAAGWIYSNQSYDWKGRPLVTTDQDNKTKVASYSGCGCAGGEVVTLQDEGTIINSELKRRTQKIYSDVLGRAWKTETLNWDSSVYSTAVTVFNARDQVLLTNEYAGSAPADASSTNTEVSCPTGSCQQSLNAYDGYARLQSKHVSEQDAGAANVYAYNPDDTILSITDARGTSATYAHNSRHMITGITYAVPQGSDIPIAPSVTFGYDAAGNRISMTDGLGSQSFTYNSLSRMTAETRTFADTAAPFLNASYTLNYDYNLAGELKTITDPWGGTINYGFDSIGRLNGVNGSGYGSVTQFASNLQYRAWGTLKSETYGNGFTQTATYNSSLQMIGFELRKPTTELLMSTTTDYYPDGSVKFTHDQLDERFDRASSYDHLGRRVEAYTGSEARNFVTNGSGGTPTGPYRQSYQFDAFHNVTQQVNRLWEANDTTTSSYVNNRMEGWLYDAAGFLISTDEIVNKRDAAGRTVQTTGGGRVVSYTFDGAGKPLKKAVSRLGLQGSITTRSYMLYSTPLGGKLFANLGSSGSISARKVYAGNRELATETFGSVTWSHKDPVTNSRAGSYSTGAFFREAEFNADGIDVGLAPPEPPEPEMPDSGGSDPGYAMLGWGSGCSISNPNCTTCILDGFETDCGHVMQLSRAGALQIEVQDSEGHKKYVDVEESLGVLYIRDQEIKWSTEGKGTWVPSDPNNPNSPFIYDPNEIYLISNTAVIQGGSVVGGTFETGERKYQHGPKKEKPMGGQTTDKADPCKGIKGNDLIYDSDRVKYQDATTAIDHITNRHIRNDIFVQASKYVFDDRFKTITDKRVAVINLNDLTFELAKDKMVRLPGGDLAFSFDYSVFNVHLDAMFERVHVVWLVGVDNSTSGGGKPTAINTLILKGDDCRTVVTSHPGGVGIRR